MRDLRQVDDVLDEFLDVEDVATAAWAALEARLDFFIDVVRRRPERPLVPGRTPGLLLRLRRPLAAEGMRLSLVLSLPLQQFLDETLEVRELAPRVGKLALELLDANVAWVALRHDARRSPRRRRCPLALVAQLIAASSEADRCAIHVRREAANLVDTGISVVGSAGAGAATASVRLGQIRATDPLAKGLSNMDLLRKWDQGSRALNAKDFAALGGPATSPLAKADMMARGVDQAGKVYAVETGFFDGMAMSTTLIGTGVTPSAAAGSAVMSTVLATGSAAINSPEEE